VTQSEIGKASLVGVYEVNDRRLRPTFYAHLDTPGEYTIFDGRLWIGFKSILTTGRTAGCAGVAITWRRAFSLRFVLEMIVQCRADFGAQSSAMVILEADVQDGSKFVRSCPRSEFAITACE
jgi:hypothetical protein